MHKPSADRITLAEFLEWDNTQNDRNEWIDGSVVRCNALAIVRSRVAGGRCFVSGSDRKLVPKDVEGREFGLVLQRHLRIARGCRS